MRNSDRFELWLPILSGLFIALSLLVALYFGGAVYLAHSHHSAMIQRQEEARRNPNEIVFLRDQFDRYMDQQIAEAENQFLAARQTLIEMIPVSVVLFGLGVGCRMLAKKKQAHRKANSPRSLNEQSLDSFFEKFDS